MGTTGLPQRRRSQQSARAWAHARVLPRPLKPQLPHPWKTTDLTPHLVSILSREITDPTRRLRSRLSWLRKSESPTWHALTRRQQLQQWQPWKRAEALEAAGKNGGK